MHCSCDGLPTESWDKWSPPEEDEIATFEQDAMDRKASAQIRRGRNSTAEPSNMLANVDMISMLGSGSGSDDDSDTSSSSGSDSDMEGVTAAASDNATEKRAAEPRALGVDNRASTRTVVGPASVSKNGELAAKPASVTSPGGTKTTAGKVMAKDPLEASDSSSDSSSDSGSSSSSSGESDNEQAAPPATKSRAPAQETTKLEARPSNANLQENAAVPANQKDACSKGASHSPKPATPTTNSAKHSKSPASTKAKSPTPVKVASPAADAAGGGEATVSIPVSPASLTTQETKHPKSGGAPVIRVDSYSSAEGVAASSESSDKNKNSPEKLSAALSSDTQKAAALGMDAKRRSPEPVKQELLVSQNATKQPEELPAEISLLWPETCTKCKPTWGGVGNYLHTCLLGSRCICM